MLSAVILLHLLIQQIYLSHQLETVQVAVSSTVDLPCSLNTQNIEPTNPAKIVWIRDDRADIVSLDTLITVRDARLSILQVNDLDRQERILRITNVDEQDHGLYRCIHGDMTLNEILLDVLIPPRIVSHSPEHMHMTVHEGQDAQFSCAATGHPTPIIVWQVNGLLKSDKIMIEEGKNESVLVLHNVSRFDAGRVDCSASNTLATVNRQFLLHVKYKPSVLIPYHLLQFRLHDSATITCQVCSIPSATIFDIFRPKQSIPMVHGVKEKFDITLNETCKQLILTIHLNEASLFGPYVCRARNALGVNYAEFLLKEIIHSTKHIKSTTAFLPAPTLSVSRPTIETETVTYKRNVQVYRITTETIARKNQSYKLSISVLLWTILFLLTI